MVQSLLNKVARVDLFHYNDVALLTKIRGVGSTSVVRIREEYKFRTNLLDQPHKLDFPVPDNGFKR